MRQSNLRWQWNCLVWCPDGRILSYVELGRTSKLENKGTISICSTFGLFSAGHFGIPQPNHHRAYRGRRCRSRDQLCVNLSREGPFLHKLLSTYDRGPVFWSAFPALALKAWCCFQSLEGNRSTPWAYKVWQPIAMKSLSLELGTQFSSALELKNSLVASDRCTTSQLLLFS